MLRILLLSTLALFPLTAAAQNDRGEAIGQLLADGLVDTADWLKENGPSIVDQGQILLDEGAAAAAPLWRRTLLAGQVTADYNRFCSIRTQGAYANTPLCTVLRPKIARSPAPLTRVFDGLAQQTGVNANGEPNSAGLLALAMAEHLQADPIEGYGFTPHTLLDAIYDNLRHCNGTANQGCSIDESQGAEFAVILKDILALLEARYGVSGNPTADATQVVKEALNLAL